MDQITKLIHDDDTLENSWENNKVIIRTEMAALARTLIMEKKVKSLNEAINKLQNIENIIIDKTFCDLFPNIFNIELFKYNLKHK